MIRKTQTITGETLIPPQAVISLYRREIVNMVIEMIKDYRPLLALFSEKHDQMAMDDNTWITTDMEKRLDKLGKKWRDAFEEFAQNKSKRMVQKVLKQSDLQIKRVLRDWFAQKRWQLIPDTIPVQMQQTIKAHVAENVSLITSIATQYHERITGAVYRAITGVGTYRQLQRDFIKFGNMSSRRAKLVASDQVHKTFITLSARRMASLGIKRFMWKHGHSKEPRPYHIRFWDGQSGKNDGHPNGLNGFIFTLENPPVINEKTGEHGLPGRLPYCSCRMAPVFDDAE